MCLFVRVWKRLRIARVYMKAIIHFVCCVYLRVCCYRSQLNLWCYIDILRKFDDMIEVILPQLPTSFDSITDPEGRAALVWVLGEYGEVQYTLFLLFSINICNLLSTYSI